jgi:hypothetical protein
MKKTHRRDAEERGKSAEKSHASQFLPFICALSFLPLRSLRFIFSRDAVMP